jgi:hypothetical protein
MSITQRVASRFKSAVAVPFTPQGIMGFAHKLSRRVGGSSPKHTKFRWSDSNESAVFITYSPDYSAKVVVLVSVFEDETMAISIFNDEDLSELNRFENISSFTYDEGNLNEMQRDIKWVWETVDKYAKSWEE